MLKQDTPLPENDVKSSPNGAKTNVSDIHGSSPAPERTAEEMSHGQESYPGTRSGGEADKAARTPAAGDVDPGSTREAENTGQGGKPKTGPQETGNPWNG